MKVRILSGNQAGAVVEMREDEAETAIATGYGEEYVEPKPEKEEKPKPKHVETHKAPVRHK